MFFLQASQSDPIRRKVDLIPRPPRAFYSVPSLVLTGCLPLAGVCHCRSVKPASDTVAVLLQETASFIQQPIA